MEISAMELSKCIRLSTLFTQSDGICMKNETCKFVEQIIKIKIWFYFTSVFSVCLAKLEQTNREDVKVYSFFVLFSLDVVRMSNVYFGEHCVLANYYPQWWWHAWIVFIFFYLSFFRWLCIFRCVSLHKMSSVFYMFQTEMAQWIRTIKWWTINSYLPFTNGSN